jgi:hypothetical protein
LGTVYPFCNQQISTTVYQIQVNVEEVRASCS